MLCLKISPPIFNEMHFRRSYSIVSSIIFQCYRSGLFEEVSKSLYPQKRVDQHIAVHLWETIKGFLSYSFQPHLFPTYYVSIVMSLLTFKVKFPIYAVTHIRIAFCLCCLLCYLYQCVMMLKK